MGFRKVFGGSLYIDGKAANVQKKYRDYDVGVPYQGGKVEIGDTSSEEGARIHWLQPEGMNILVADRPLLRHISWNNLGMLGKGTEVTIDGKQYQCWLPMVEKDNDGEWARIVSAMKDDLSSLNGDSVYSYAMTPDSLNKSVKPVVRTARGSRSTIDNDQNLHDVGFRPILRQIWSREPILPGRMFKLDGSTFSIGCPYGGANTLGKGVFNDWDYAMNAFDWDNHGLNELRTISISSWCQKGGTTINGRRSAFIRGGDTTYNRKVIEANTRRNEIGFRPLLCPMKRIGTELVPDYSVFAGIPDGTQLQMYTMMVNGKPVLNGTLYAFRETDEISFTDQFFGDKYLISWIVFNGRAIAKRNLVTKISWEDLEKQGYCK